MNMSMLPHHQRIFFEVGHVVERRLRPQLEQQPADVRVEKPLADVVRIAVVIDVFMVPAMLARPHQDGVLECGSAEEKCEQAHRQLGPESCVRKQPVIAERDAEAGRGQQYCEHDHVEPINAEIPQVQRHRGQRQHKRSDQKRACRPINAIERDARNHVGNLCKTVINYQLEIARPRITSSFDQA